MSYSEEFEDRWFWETDSDGRLTYLTKAVADQIEMFGTSTLGEPVEKIFQIDRTDAQHLRSLKFHIVSRTSFTEYPVRGAKGLHESWWSMSGRPWFGADGEFAGFVGSGTDLTKIRKHEATIRRLAITDSLTGLANRQRMQDNLNALLKSEPHHVTHCALMMLDLDGFKGVNDTLGHPVGDLLLKQVAQRLLSIVDDTGMVGRLGGDEFQVLIPGRRTRTRLSELAHQIIEGISSPYVIDGLSVTISCSIGISVSDTPDAPDILVRNADLALYAAKAGGRATFVFFEEEMLIKARWRRNIEDDLREALNKGQLKLLFQPIVATQSEVLTGFEALLRWEHPVEGYISPTKFIPIAEDSGLIQKIGDWVIRDAVRVIASLPDDLRVAVNVSPIQFANPALLSTLASAIAQSQIDPSRLELEITESVFLDSEGSAQRTFKALKALGVRLALDDFGTGYSSLYYLQHAPFDKIKIDQSFIRDAVDPRSRNSAIIESIVALSRALDMETTAEGVEHQDEIELIRQLGCSHIQGHVYGPAMDISDLIPELEAGVRRMRAIGPKRSRRPRTKLIRSALMRLNEGEVPVVIKNVSEAGAMIEHVCFSPQMVGVSLQLAVLGDELSHATIRWVGEGRAGLEFFEPISLDAII